MLKDILKGAGSDAIKYFPVRFVPALTSLITVPVFTRAIGRAEYGDFYLVTAATSLAATLATAWISNAVVRYYWVYEKEDRVDEYVATTLWSTILSIGLIVTLAAAGVFLFEGGLSPGVVRLVPVGLASLSVNYLVAVMLQVLRAANKATWFSSLSVASTIISTAFSVFFVWALDWGAYGILAGVVVGNVIVMPFGLSVASREGSLSPRFLRRDVLAEFMRYGFPLVPAAVSSWVLVLADRYVLGAFRTQAEVGLYSVAYGLGDKIMALVTLPLIITMGPVMVHTFEKQGEKLAQQVQTQFTRYFAMATFPLLLGMYAASKHFMAVFTGPEYRAGFIVLPIVATGTFFYGFVQLAANGIALHKRSTVIMSNTLAAALFNVGINLVLVPRFGYLAAAFDTVASYFLLLALTWYRSRPFMAWKPPWLDVGRIVLASAIMAVVLVLVFWRLPSSVWMLLVEVVAGLAIYAAALWALRGVRQDEMEWLGEVRRAALRRVGLGR